MRLLLPAMVAALTAAPALADVTPFETPSGNIQCSVGTGEGPPGIECMISELSGAPTTPRPAGCNGVWGHRFAMGERGVVTLQCGSPLPRDRAPAGNIAQYGKVGQFGGIVCQSSEAGLECRNADGHGFFLSRRRQSVF